MKTIQKILLSLVIVFSLNSLYAQVKIAGVSVPEKITFGGEELLLNGVGIREKMWIDLYVGALYLPYKSTDSQKIISDDKPMAVRLNIVSKLITSKKMIAAVEDGFEASTNGNIKPLQSRINELIGLFDDEIQKGDIFDLVYIPNIGLECYKNGSKKGVITGIDFKKALFGIWLSNSPADKGLRNDMLGID